MLTQSKILFILKTFILNYTNKKKKKKKKFWRKFIFEIPPSSSGTGGGGGYESIYSQSEWLIYLLSALKWKPFCFLKSEVLVFLACHHLPPPPIPQGLIPYLYHHVWNPLSATVFTLLYTVHVTMCQIENTLMWYKPQWRRQGGKEGAWWESPTFVFVPNPPPKKTKKQQQQQQFACQLVPTDLFLFCLSVFRPWL